MNACDLPEFELVPTCGHVAPHVSGKTVIERTSPVESLRLLINIYDFNFATMVPQVE